MHEISPSSLTLGTVSCRPWTEVLSLAVNNGVSITLETKSRTSGNDKAFENPSFDPVFDDSKRVEAIDRAYQMHEQGYQNPPLETLRDWENGHWNDMPA